MDIEISWMSSTRQSYPNTQILQGYSTYSVYTTATIIPYMLYMLSRRAPINKNRIVYTPTLKLPLTSPKNRLRTMIFRRPNAPTSPQTLCIKISRPIIKKRPYGIMVKPKSSDHTGKKRIDHQN